MNSHAVIAIGGGHAGVEAACAAARALASVHGVDSPRARVALVTMDPSRIGTMSCNPAIGGLAKGQMVREIDALGGVMGLATDATGIMFKVLNASKGAAVRGPRAQCDKYAYACEVQRLVAMQANIDVIAGTVEEFLVERGVGGALGDLGEGRPCVTGVVVSDCLVVSPDERAIEWNATGAGLARPVYSCPFSRPRGRRWPEGPDEGGVATGALRVATPPSPGGYAATLSRPRGRGDGQILRARAVVLTTGTFMRALMHTGETKTPGGRVGEGSAVGISAALRSLGFDLGRLKTGTPPRLRRGSIDWEGLEAQHGDGRPTPFSEMTRCDRRSHPTDEARPTQRFPRLPQIACRITETTAAIHEVIRANIHRAPMYSGQIDAECGPRYCPSIEDKVVRFADRESHHVFLEPESLHTDEIYCNGVSTSLPSDVQDTIVRGMRGCEAAEIVRYGYAVEYDMVWPHQIDATCETKRIAGLFLAGQINGTSGYEEAGGQGLVAGINAARRVFGAEPVRLGRDQAYIGVMMDDLVTKAPREPYRMFTSRAEHRLTLRADNTADRLTPLGRELGLVDDVRWAVFDRRRELASRVREVMDSVRVDGRVVAEHVRRPETTIDEVLGWIEDRLTESAAIDRAILVSFVEQAMTDVRYEPFVVRAQAETRRLAESERMRVPAALDPDRITGLRAEARDVLRKFRPATLGQASRLAGINPADVSLIAVAIRRGGGAVATSAST